MLSKIPADVAWALGVGGALVAAVGWLDDRRGVSARVRATVHAAAACWAAYWIWGELTPAAVAGVVCIIWAINLYNFMDGIDGLAGAEASSVGLIAGALFLMAGATTSRRSHSSWRLGPRDFWVGTGRPHGSSWGMWARASWDSPSGPCH